MLIRKTPLKAKTPLKRGKRLNTHSLKKIEEMRAEVPIRIALCKRAGGTPVETKITAYHSGKAYPITRVVCVGGVCECGCDQRTSGELHPHEQHSRGRGGKLSMANSIMVINEHHAVLQNNIPKWSKK